MKKPDVIVVFAFTKDGKANSHIALTGKNRATQYNVPIFTQKDVGRYLHDSKCDVFSVDEEEKYLSTLGIVKALKESAEKHGWKKVGLVAAPCHEWRCSRDLRKMGFIVYTDDYLRSAYRSKFWFNPNDPQIWVHNPLIWWMREIVLRLIPWNIYFKFAS